MILFKKILLTISATENLTSKVGKSRISENISPKKAMIHENPIIFEKLLRNDSEEKFHYKKHY